VSAASLPQYLTAVSRYHELAYVANPTKTVLVRSLTRAYDRAFDLCALLRARRVGLPADLMRRVLTMGLATQSLLWCAMLPWSRLCFCLDVVRQRRWACGIQILPSLTRA
jgi:hypothetical protein